MSAVILMRMVDASENLEGGAVESVFSSAVPGSSAVLPVAAAEFGADSSLAKQAPVDQTWAAPPAARRDDDDSSEPLAPAGTRPAALGPVAAMLSGGVLACILVGMGMLIGSRGAVTDPSTFAGTAFSGVDAGSGNAIVNAVKMVGPAVMNVDTEFGKGGSPEFIPSPGTENMPQQGKGTGVVIDSRRGLMLTNAHVVAGAEKIQVTTQDGNRYTGRLLGSDKLSDIAVVVLSNKTLHQARLSHMTDPRKDLAIGQWAIAIGNPYAQANTVTVGVVSAVGRTIPVPDGKNGRSFQLTEMIQTDAAINPGNSGGPLCNIRGEVIGINTAIIPFATGLGFTIPINKAMSVAEQIIKNGKVSHPYIGISMLPITDALAKDFGMPDNKGALVQAVEPKSPAGRAGLLQGDVVRAVDGKAVKNAEEIQGIIAAHKVGDTVKLSILRNNRVKHEISLKIGDRPNN